METGDRDGVGDGEMIRREIEIKRWRWRERDGEEDRQRGKEIVDSIERGPLADTAPMGTSIAG